MSDEKAELLRGYGEKKAWDSNYPWIFYVARPISFPLTLFLRRLGATPDGVTGLTALLGLASLPALASGRPRLMFWGGLFLLLYTIFDCVDGNLARAWPQTATRAGKYWDGLVGNFYILSYFVLGMGLGGETWPVIGAFVTIAKLLACRVKTDFWTVLGGAWEADKKDSGYVPHTGTLHYKLYYNLTDPQAHIFLLPFAVLYGSGAWFLGASALVSAADLVFVTALYLARSAKLNKK